MTSSIPASNDAEVIILIAETVQFVEPIVVDDRLGQNMWSAAQVHLVAPVVKGTHTVTIKSTDGCKNIKQDVLKFKQNINIANCY